MNEVERLRQRIIELENELREKKDAVATREKIKHMSEEVVDSNPYR